MGKEFRKGKAVEWTLGSSGNDNEQIGIRFEVVDLPEGCPDTWYGTFTDKAKPFTVKTMQACGWNGQWTDPLVGLDANEVELVFMPEEYEGSMYWKLKYVNPTGGGAGIAMKAPMSDEQKRAFFARMKSGAPAPARAPAAPPSRGGGGRDPRPEDFGITPAKDDDLPF